MNVLAMNDLPFSRLSVKVEIKMIPCFLEVLSRTFRSGHLSTDFLPV